MAELVARRRPDDPVPVRVSLVGWDPDKTKFQPWLIDRIHRLLGATGLSFDQVENLVRAHRVLPVLDDLDQMDPPGTPAAGSLAVHALQKLREYHDTSASAPLILLCRSDVYRRLQDARIELPEAAHVRLEPVSADQVIRYLAERSENPSRWEPVSNRMTARPDGVLAQSLNTPWQRAGFNGAGRFRGAAGGG